MIDPRDYIISKNATISDIDLDEEEFYLPDGRRLTNELADQLAEETLAEARRRGLVGRRSLTGGSTHSPRVQFRVPEPLLAEAERRAAEEGITLSALAREALEHYLAS